MHEHFGNHFSGVSCGGMACFVCQKCRKFSLRQIGDGAPCYQNGPVRQAKGVYVEIIEQKIP